MTQKTNIPVIKTFIDPLTDFGFKKLFGEEESKEFLISFLNSLLKDYGAPEIYDLTYRNTEILGAEILDRKVIFDLYCTTKEGINFVVELQKGHQLYYKNRSLCYGCMAITDQMQKGVGYKFELNKVFVVSILNFSMPETRNKPVDKYVHSYIFRDEDDYIGQQDDEVMFDNFRFVFIELPKFNKIITQTSSIVDKWIHLFKDLVLLTETNMAYADELWTKFFQRAKIKNLQTMELQQYEESVSFLSQIQDVKDAVYCTLLNEKTAIEEKLKQSEIVAAEKLKQTEIEAAEKLKQSEMVAAEKLKQSEVIAIENLLSFGISVVDIQKKYPHFTEVEIIALK